VSLNLSKKNAAFFELLEQQARIAHKAAEVMAAMSKDLGNADQYAHQIDKLEDEGDSLVHQLANMSDASFVTPLDKEDLHALSGSLDDIVDNIDACSARIVIYRILQSKPHFVEGVRLLTQAAEVTVVAVKALRSLRKASGLHETLVKIHHLENQADEVFRAALGDLFNTPGSDPIDVMKWKEVYDRVERSVDSCEDIATLVESVVVKYA
jgi:uncharacterized protein Yka (UPF0111/DUF47 family)